MPSNLDFDNFIFDLYGTLIDIHTDERGADTWKKWCRFLDEKNIKHPEYRQFGKDFFQKDSDYRIRAAESGKYDFPEIDVLDVYEELFEGYGNGRLSGETLWELSYGFRMASRQYIRLFDGVMEFLAALKNKKKRIFLLSNAQASYTLPELELTGLKDVFDDIFISSDRGVMKPDPAFFNLLIEGHGLDKKRTLMIGDSLENDVRGAMAAGVSYIWLNDDNRAEGFYVKLLDSQGVF